MNLPLFPSSRLNPFRRSRAASCPAPAILALALALAFAAGIRVSAAETELQPFAFAQGSLNEQEDRADTPRTGEKLLCLAGDSTVTYNAGYAAGLRAHFDRRLQVINRSRGGRTTASFRADGRWQDVLNLKPDYVLIQFGHNDGAVLSNEVYAQNLARFVDEARAAGITPAAIDDRVKNAYVTAALAADPVYAQWRQRDQYNALDPARVRLPTLLIQGEHDPSLPSEALGKFFTRLGTADREWIIIPGSDHAAILENTQPLVIDALLAFLRRRAP